jgi:nucleotide-binding universal stress UspA family protein
MFSTDWESHQTAGTANSTPSTPFLSVVGFDGTPHALRALDRSVAQLRGREGSIELVYVADPPAQTRQISDEVREHLLTLERRWRFQRRDGTNVPEQLIAVADELQQKNGTDAEIGIVVGSSSEHRTRVVLALIQTHRYPVLVVP